MILVPEAFAASTVEREGEAGRAWIDGLPSRIEYLCEKWDLEACGAPLHGYVAIAVPVTRRGTERILKISWVDRWSEHEALALGAWRGRGAVRLFESDPEHGAMLLERLDPERSLELPPADEAARIAAGLLRRLAIPAPDGLRSLEDEFRLVRTDVLSLWERTGRPYPRRLLESTLQRAETSSGKSPVIVNYDLHFGNVLAGEREPWLVIDPKVVAGDLEYAAAQLLWTRFPESDTVAELDRRWSILVETAELDPELAAQWSLLRALEYWVWSLSVGFTEGAAMCRALVDWLLTKKEIEPPR